MGESEDIHRILLEINRELGELHAKVDNLSARVQAIRDDVDTLMTYKSHIVGIGSAVTFGIAAVGFLFGDIIRSFIRKSLGN
jgi:hypothetical protein